MIGWWLVISTQTPEERRQAVDRKAFISATWEVWPGGLDWLEELVVQGRAGRLRTDGYPDVHVAADVVVLPLLEDGPPAHDGLGVFGNDM